MPRPVIVAGATGLVGAALVDALRRAPEFAPVVALARRPQPEGEGVEWRVRDFGALTAADVPQGAAAAFCALGTTIKKAGSQAAFREVDHGHVLRFARACKEAGVAQFHVVSAIGADPRSRVFYSRVKGEMEDDVHDLGFPSTTVYRPSFLVGDRAESRPGERIGIALAKVLAPVLPERYRAVRAEDVAGAMVRNALAAERGYHVVEGRHIAESAGSRI